MSPVAGWWSFGALGRWLHVPAQLAEILVTSPLVPHRPPPIPGRRSPPDSRSCCRSGAQFLRVWAGLSKQPGAEVEVREVTVLLANVVEGPRLWEEHPQDMRQALTAYDAAFASALLATSGRQIGTRGESEGVLALFDDAPSALRAALLFQQALLAPDWPAPVRLPARVAIHTGSEEESIPDHFGPVVNRGTMLRSMAVAGQVLTSEEVVTRVEGKLPPGAELRKVSLDRGHSDDGRPDVFLLFHPDLPVPAVGPSLSTPSNLPQEATSFVGREREVANLHRLLETSRLVTLTGPGGTGKTRLALHVAAGCVSRFPDGVFLVELETVSEASQVALTVLAAVGGWEFPDMSAMAALSQYLRERDVLLVLDNCEHVVAAVAQLAAGLLRYCPRTRLLVTSREPLSTAGETIISVSPLGCPDPRQLPSLERLATYDAVRLFIDRALAADAGFAVDNANAPAVAEICSRLDGIPMAIELAAARVRTLTPAQIAERLSDRFHLLTGKSRTSLPRQQTLRALVDWSYDLLSESERAVWRRLCVFSGGCILQGAEAVAGFAPVAPEDVVDLVEQLVDKSILYRTEAGEQARYLMLETLRAYGTDRLEEAGERSETEARYMAFEVALCERLYWEHAGLELAGEYGVPRDDFRARMQAESATLLSALGQALDNQDLASAWRLGAGLGFPDTPSVSSTQELAALLARLIRAGPGAAPPDIYFGTCLLGWIRLEVEADLDDRLAQNARAAAIVRDDQTEWGKWLYYVSLSQAAFLWSLKDDEVQASRLQEAAVGAAQGPYQAAVALVNLAEGEFWRGNRERAIELLDLAQQRSEEAGSPAVSSAPRAMFALADGDITLAESLLVNTPITPQMSRFGESVNQGPLAVLWAATDRGADALGQVAGSDDKALLENLSDFAAATELALSDLVPEQAAVVSGLRERAWSHSAWWRPIVPAIEAARARVRAALGDARWQQQFRLGAELRGLDRLQALREAAQAGLRHLGSAQQMEAVTASADVEPMAKAARAGGPAEDEALVVARTIPRLSLRELTVVGDYRRYDERVKNQLRDWQRRMSLPLRQDTSSHENFLIWAAPGSGKSFLVQETARALGDGVRYFELNLARLPKEEFLHGLAEVRGSTAPLICLLDEIDARAEENWPYEEVFPLLDLNLDPVRRAVFVLVGSHPQGMRALLTEMGARRKGQDLLDRVPADQRFVIPAPTLEDRAVIVASHVLNAAAVRGQPVEEVERLALYYTLTDPSLTTPRQFRDLAVAAVQNLPQEERRLKYDDLFYRGDTRKHAFWMAHSAAAEELSGVFVTIVD